MDSKTSIHSLPHDVMLQIFGYFPKVEVRKTLAPVCKRWLTLSRDSYFLKDICVSRQRGSTNFIPKNPLLNLVGCAKQLNSFTIENEKFVSDVFFALAKNCPSLTALEATNCQHLSDAAIKQLATSCTRLTVLNLEGTTGVLKGGYRYIAKLHLLTHLNVELCGDQFDGQITCLDQPGFTSIVTQCPLQSLLMFDGDFCIRETEFRFLGEKMSESLKELSLNSSKISSPTLSQVSKYQNLDLLYIGGSTMIFKDLLEALARLPKLRSLSLVMHIEQDTPCIAFLQLFHTDATANLTKLELQNFKNIDNGVCMMLALNCKNLVYLSLVNTMITDSGVDLLAYHCHFIKEIDLSYNSEMRLHCLASMGKKLLELKRIVLEPVLTKRKETNLSVFKILCPDVVVAHEEMEW